MLLTYICSLYIRASDVPKYIVYPDSLRIYVHYITMSLVYPLPCVWPLCVFVDDISMPILRACSDCIYVNDVVMLSAYRFQCTSMTMVCLGLLCIYVLMSLCPLCKSIPIVILSALCMYVIAVSWLLNVPVTRRDNKSNNECISRTPFRVKHAQLP